MESLYKVFPLEMWPKEYGGGGDSIQDIIGKCNICSIIII